MTDISLEDLMKKAGTIYEAVVVMCRRARQINDEQKLQIDMEMDATSVPENRDSEDFDEVEIDREALQREYKKYPKPSKVAIEEMAKGDIQYSYNIPSEEEKEEKKS